MSTALNLVGGAEPPLKVRKAAISEQRSIFTEIYKENINIAVWKRELSSEVKACVDQLINSGKAIQETMVVTPSDILTKLTESNREFESVEALCRDIAELVEMYCLLFDLKQVGLRIATLDRAMCPRFHVDRVLCRLVCTYEGTATEWLPHDKVDHSKRGRGNNGLADEESGLFQNKDDVRQLQIGDVALLKGELWPENENAGLVHRSPKVPAGENRLLLTLDSIS